jgi:hypothetical protein
MLRVFLHIGHRNLVCAERALNRKAIDLFGSCASLSHAHHMEQGSQMVLVKSVTWVSQLSIFSQQSYAFTDGRCRRCGKNAAVFAA